MFFGKFLRIGSLAAGALIAVAGLASIAGAQPRDPAASVADDGSEVFVRHRSGTTSRSFPGYGRDLRFGEKDDARAAPRSRLEEEEDERRLRRAKPIRPATAQEGVTAETIIGTDQRRRVTPTTTYPARATALILFTSHLGESLCTGFLIGRDTVATAGHCVARGNGSGFYDRTTYRIYPGRDGGGVRPYGECGASRLFSVGAWVNQGRDDLDYGAIKLDCDIGSTTGWYGLTVNFPGVGTPTTVQGYPGDKPFTQWLSRDQVRALDPRRVFYQNDTVGGMSGSPVWINKNSNCTRCAIAIHAYGTYNGPPFSTNNHGTRITQGVFNNLNAWKNAP